MSVLSTLFGNRFSKPSGRRRGHDVRLNRTVRSNQLEGLEKRQMLAADVTLDFEIDWNQNRVNANDGSYVVNISRQGDVPGGVDIGLAGGDGVYIHNTFDPDLNGAAYSFYSEPNLDPETRAFVGDWTTSGTLETYLEAQDADLLAGSTTEPLYQDNIVRNYNFNNFNFDKFSQGRRAFRSDASIDITYVNKITVTAAGKMSFTTDTLDLWDFTDIEATATGDDVTV